MQAPAAPGTYALVLILDRPRRIAVGHLGTFDFPAGRYVYVGSALGPGGLAARVARHLRREKRLYWHVDYLLRYARVAEVWIRPGLGRRECAWAQAAAALPGATIAVPRFGASDCRCAGHLVCCTAKAVWQEAERCFEASV